ECMVFLLMGGAYLRSRIKQAGKWDQETIVSFFLCQYCSGEYLLCKSRRDLSGSITKLLIAPIFPHF
ncbi:hypothetical protein, partial [Aeromonas caviae]|uniref:hypothetical protein n=1 Tax=Aeromonas caviae TaxID=648 RepID=UPI002B24AF92